MGDVLAQVRRAATAEALTHRWVWRLAAMITFVLLTTLGGYLEVPLPGTQAGGQIRQYHETARIGKKARDTHNASGGVGLFFESREPLSHHPAWAQVQDDVAGP